MNQIFKITNGFIVPDGTKVFPFLNSKDCMSNLPFDLLDEFSISAGEILQKSKSKIHIHPLVKQVTFVLEGEIIIRMKHQLSSIPYDCKLKKYEAVLTEEGTFYQLNNESDKVCKVLYIVSPAYLFEIVDDQVVYDDAIVLDEGWDQLAQLNWNPEKLINSNMTLENRNLAYQRVKIIKSKYLK